MQSITGSQLCLLLAMVLPLSMVGCGKNSTNSCDQEFWQQQQNYWSSLNVSSGMSLDSFVQGLPTHGTYSSGSCSAQEQAQVVVVQKLNELEILWNQNNPDISDLFFKSLQFAGGDLKRAIEERLIVSLLADPQNFLSRLKTFESKIDLESLISKSPPTALLNGDPSLSIDPKIQALNSVLDTGLAELRDRLISLL